MSCKWILTSLVISCIILTACLSGCSKIGNNGDPTDYSGTKIPLDSGELGKYVIMRSETAEKAEIDAAIELRNAILKFSDIDLTTDWVKRGDEVPSSGDEILVGTTNRDETNELTQGLRLNDFVIGRLGTRIVIAGGSDTATEKAVDYFINNFVDSEAKTVSLPEEIFIYSAAYKVNELKINGIPITGYSIAAMDEAAEYAAETLSSNIASLTGYKLGEAEKTITFHIGGDTDDKCRISSDDGGILIEAGDRDGIITAGKYFLDKIIGTEKLGEDKTGAALNITLDKTVEYDMNELKCLEPLKIYISSDGDDTNIGTEESPLKTLEIAVDSAREKSLTSLAPIEIILKNGDYYIDKTIEFDSIYFGTKYAPITIKAEETGKVNFIGGVKADSSIAKKVTDESVLSRLADKNAADKLMVLDLSGVVDSIPEISVKGTSGDARYPMEIYFGEKALTKSRWPNDVVGEAYLRSSDKLEYTNFENAPITFGYIDQSSHAKQYWSEDTIKNLYLFSYLGYDWYNDVVKIKSLDADTNTVITESGITYEPHVGTRFYFFNILEDIDVPGESYIDRENKLVYYYPYEDSQEDIWISTLAGSMLNFKGVENMSVEGINFIYSRGQAIEASDAVNFTVRGCKVAHNSYQAMSLSGSGITVDGCVIYDTAAGGISISGGDRKTLTSGESIVKNCVIHDINRSEETYKPGVYADSEGLVIRNNTFYNSTHEMIAVGSNDIVIQYNEFYNCVTSSADMGAIYFGRNPSLLGIDIGYNYFHDIGNPYGGIGQQAIFIDDGSIGPYIHDNVFYRATFDSAAVKTHGAQYTKVENNVFTDMPAAMFNAEWSDIGESRQDRWWLWVYDKYNDGEHQIWDKMTSMDFESDIWHKHYDGTQWECVWYDISSEMYEKINSPEYSDEQALKKLAKEYAPVGTNKLIGNIYCSIEETDKSGQIYNGGYVIYENNAAVSESDFKVYGKDFGLTESALKEVKKNIPDFRNIDMSKIGPNNNG